MLLTSDDAARYVSILRQHFVIRRLGKGRFFLKARSREGFKYLLDQWPSRGGIFDAAFAVEESVMLLLCEDWTDEHDLAFLRLILTLWLATVKPRLVAGPNCTETSAHHWPDAEDWSFVVGSGEGI